LSKEVIIADSPTEISFKVMWANIILFREILNRNKVYFFFILFH